MNEIPTKHKKFCTGTIHALGFLIIIVRAFNSGIWGILLQTYSTVKKLNDTDTNQNRFPVKDEFRMMQVMPRV